MKTSRLLLLASSFICLLVVGKQLYYLFGYFTDTSSSYRAEYLEGSALIGMISFPVWTATFSVSLTLVSLRKMTLSDAIIPLVSGLLPGILLATTHLLDSAA